MTNPRIGIWVLLALGVVGNCAYLAQAAHQTDTFSPLILGGTPFALDVRTMDNPWADLPTLHSFAKAQWEGKWILWGGRTNGMHGFSSIGMMNFPTETQNRDVWVVDPATGQVWHRSLPDSGLDPHVVAALSTANMESLQQGDKLYLVGGYGASVQGGLDTLDTFTSLDLPSWLNWVQHPEQVDLPHVQQRTDPMFRVTGGALELMDGRLHLVFGQDFRGGYVPGKNGTYTQQVRSFRVDETDSGLVIDDVSQSEVNDVYRRRDLNVLPSYHQDEQGAMQAGATVLSGVFTPTNGIWTAPVEIDAKGVPAMQPVESFRQSVNGYHSAKIGLYSREQDLFAGVLMGGITLESWDPELGVLQRDDGMPFTNQIAAVMRDRSGAYSQHWLGEFPELYDDSGQRLRFGANAEFFMLPSVPRWENGLIDLDAITDEMVIGYVFGGIVTNGPHTRNVPGVMSSASDSVFEVRLRPVPEPQLAGLVWGGLAVLGFRSRNVFASRPSLASAQR